MKKLILISASVIFLVALGLSQQIMGYVNHAYVTKVEEQLQIALTQLPEGIQINYEGIESTRSLNEAKIHRPIILYNNSPIFELDGDLFVKAHANEISFQTKGNIIVSNSEAVITAPIAFTLNKESEVPYAEMSLEDWMNFVNRVEIRVGQGKILFKSSAEDVTLAALDQFTFKFSNEHAGEFNNLVKFQTQLKNLSFPGLTPAFIKQFVASNSTYFSNLETTELNVFIEKFPELFPSGLGNINYKLNGTVNYPSANALQEGVKIAKANDETKAFQWMASQGYFAEIELKELSDHLATTGAKINVNYGFENNPRLTLQIESDISVTSQYDQFFRKMLDYSVANAFEEIDPSKADLKEFYNSHKTEILDLFPQLHKAGKYKLKSDFNFEFVVAEYDLLIDYNINYQIEKPGYEFDVTGNFKPSPFKPSHMNLDLQPKKMTIKVKNYAKFFQDLVELVNRAHEVFVELNPNFPKIQPEQVQFGIVAVKQFSDNPKSNDSDISFTFDFTDLNNVKLGNHSLGNFKN